ncbi:hypothetical protein [Leptothermofonsia sp. ETS-13]|uniref:hypothetical protein n=1 Tax=Leptothermofonsia sp. ETS-13 TaxID=3035696 RepID=UPI003BA092BA
MYNLTSFTLSDMTECGAALRKIGTGAVTMEAVANRIIRYLYENFIDPETGRQSLALVRLFKTHLYEDLEPELRSLVQQSLGGEPHSR